MNEAATIAADPIKSPIMCRKAPRTLISPLPERRSASIIPPFSSTAADATQSITFVSTAAGCINRAQLS